MRKVLLVATIALAIGFRSGVAHADPVTKHLTSAGSNALGGVMIGPYYGTVDGTPEAIICDDFVSDSYIDETWTANVSTIADVAAGTSTAKFQSMDNALKKYEKVMWLSTKLLDPTLT